MLKKWVEKTIDEEKAHKLRLKTGLSKLTCKLLVSRGIDTAQIANSFLYPNFANGLHNPLLLADIDKAVKRIVGAIKEGQKIICHCDYDADGVTTAAIFVLAFRILGIEIDYYVPDRFKDGYGINMHNAPMLSEYDLVISGDTGIKQFDTALELTNKYKTDLIVTDHHEPLVYPVSEKSRIPKGTTVIENEHEVMALPVCYAVINPKRIDCEYPSKDLSGAAVAFKLMEAVFMSLNHPKKELYQLLDLVACGLVPDMVHLFDVKRGTFEVRNLIKLGLSIMNTNPKPWVSAVREVTRKNSKTLRPVNEMDLGWTFGPMLNAVGRLYNPKPAVELLLESTFSGAIEKVERLNEVNSERRQLSSQNTEENLEYLKTQSEEFVDYSIVIASDKLHVGITGLVAGNVLKEYYRTTIALSKFKDANGELVYKGSARSIEGINVYDALMDVEKDFGSFKWGGHEQAAGLTIKPEQVDEFRSLFRLAVKKQADFKSEEVFEPKTYYDVNLKLKEATIQFLDEYKLFAPFGMGNEEPIFHVGDVLIKKVSRMISGKGYNLLLNQDGVLMDAVYWSKEVTLLNDYHSALVNDANVSCAMLGVPSFNDWSKKVQFVIKDIRIEPSR